MIKKLLNSGIIAFVLITTLSGSSYAAGSKHKQLDGPSWSQTELNLSLEMRSLWEDHVNYSRNYIVAAIEGNDNVGKISDRLFKNQDDIGAMFGDYYGKDMGKQLAVLLREHILILTEVVSATAAGNTAALDSAVQLWYGNADHLVLFLNTANENWSKYDLTKMFNDHLKLTSSEISSYLNKDSSQQIESFDKARAHMNNFADMLSEGIIKQFPSRK